MEHLDDIDITVMMDKGYYSSKQASDFEVHGEQKDSEEHGYSDES